MIDEKRIAKAATFCGLNVIKDPLESMMNRMALGEPPATYNSETGEITYSEKPEYTEVVECLKRTLASEPEGGEEK